MVTTDDIASVKNLYDILVGDVEIDKETRCSDDVCIYSYHGDMTSQERRQHLEEYRGLNNGTAVVTEFDRKSKPKAAIMVCTDIAARGIDIPDVSPL